MKRIVRVVILASHLLCALAHAKEVGIYQVDFEGQNKIGDQSTDWGALLMGWSCWTETSVHFNELLPDNKGRPTFEGREIRQRSDFNFITNPHVSANFERDMDIPKEQTQLRAHIFEHCSKMFSDKDLMLSWDCPFNTLPETSSTTTQTKCRSRIEWMDVGSGSSSDSLKMAILKTALSVGESLLTAKLKDKEVTGHLTFLKNEERLLRDYCNGTKQNRVLLRITQGIVGRSNENDFRYKIQINDLPELVVDRENAILHDDIAYCGPEDEIRVKISALEQDLIFDDKYKPDQADGIVLKRSEMDKVGDITLRRKTWFNKEPRENHVLIQLRDGSN